MIIFFAAEKLTKKDRPRLSLYFVLLLDLICGKIRSGGDLTGRPKKKPPVATQDEILEFLTAIMRRTVSDEIVVQNKRKLTTEDEFGNKVKELQTIPERHSVPIKLSDAMSAAEKLNKYYSQLSSGDDNEDYGVVFLPEIKEDTK